MTHVGPASSLDRIHSLDGLRGLAATVVLLHHSLLVSPGLAAPYFGGHATLWSMEWWLVNTPLHLFWEGTAAVYVFFVLSGVVLAKPFCTAMNSQRWRQYYPQRLLRLYLPVWAAVLLAVLTYWLVPRNPAMQSAWLQAMPENATAERVFRDLTLLMGNGWLASPLWSLRWEILFSLLLPIYIWIARRLSNHTAVTATACLLMVGVGGAVDQSALRYMPMFALGVILAPLITTAGFAPQGSLVRWQHRGWVPTLVAGLLFLNLRWLVPQWNESPAGEGLLIMLAAAGAVIVVLCAVAYSPVKCFLVTAPLRWLGRISFSLYLVHEPLVITSAHAFGPGYEWVAVPIALVGSLVVANLFYQVVERPSYKLAKRAGRLICSCINLRSKASNQLDSTAKQPRVTVLKE